jgi:hypothetical protein
MKYSREEVKAFLYGTNTKFPKNLFDKVNNCKLNTNNDSYARISQYYCEVR